MIKLKNKLVGLTLFIVLYLSGLHKRKRTFGQKARKNRYNFREIKGFGKYL